VAPPPRGPDYGQGDYAGIPYSPTLDHLANGTVLAWAYYDVNSYHNSTIVDNSAYGTEQGSWSLGRTYSYYTLFEIGYGNGLNAMYEAIQFPDYVPGGGGTGAWHYYGATWDGTSIIGYFDGLPFTTNSQAGYPELVTGAAGWTAIGCKVHDGTPQWDDPDAFPNWGWFGGRIDDVRVYNRALSAVEIANLYASFDGEAPSIPQSVWLRAAGSSQIEVRWNPSSDNFRVVGYRVFRNGQVAGAVAASPYIDTGLTAGTTYTYTLQAYDEAGNLSGLSAPVSTNTSPVVGSVDMVVDDADAAPWITTNGTWAVDNLNAPNFWGPDFLKTFQTGGDSVSFTPSLPSAGNYDVYVWNPGSASYSMWVFASNIPVDIVHGGTTNTVSLNEQINYASWNYLGTYAFSAGTNGYVRIRAAGTGGNLVTADAVRFVK
jgi:hypothetical protein